ncbi:MAG: protein kinase, partial [Actinomycetota bacterium]
MGREMGDLGARTWRDRYEALERIGEGGQGEVWRALDRQHGRHVALKVRPCPDDTLRERLLLEARTLLGLQPHACLPLVRDDFFEETHYVIVMEWVEGTDLGTLLRDQGDPGLNANAVMSHLSDAAAAL